MKILETPPVLSVHCDEPPYREGITRHVRFMTLTEENIKTFWEKARQHKTLFNNEVNQDFHKFCELFITETSGGYDLNGLFYVVDDFVGIFYLTHIRPGMEAHVHYSFFDGRHKGRHQLTKEMMKYAVRHYSLLRLNAEIPLYASPAAMVFVEQLGFVKEGRKRRATKYRDQYFDVNLYGILNSEVLDSGNEN